MKTVQLNVNDMIQEHRKSIKELNNSLHNLYDKCHHLLNELENTINPITIQNQLINKGDIT